MSHPSIQKAVAQNPFNNFKLHQWRNLTCLPPPSRNHKEVASHTACGKAVAAPPPPPKPCRAPPPSSRNRPRAGLPRTSCPQQGRICCLLGAGQSFRPCACVAWCVLGRPSPRMPRRWRWRGGRRRRGWRRLPGVACIEIALRTFCDRRWVLLGSGWGPGLQRRKSTLEDKLECH